tara:strand:+ start:337 stop:741 length:405 start_codon:yes stop_codon:yes gene_type:complete
MKIIFLTIATILLLTNCDKNSTKKKATENSTIKNEKLNVLLLVGDDIAFGDLGAYGSEISTPNMDKLANAGVRFSNFHASPVCSVTRSMLMTGCNNIEVGLGSFDYSFYPPSKRHKGYLTHDAVAITELFNDQG